MESHHKFIAFLLGASLLLAVLGFAYYHRATISSTIDVPLPTGLVVADTTESTVVPTVDNSTGNNNSASISDVQGNITNLQINTTTNKTYPVVLGGGGGSGGSSGGSGGGSSGGGSSGDSSSGDTQSILVLTSGSTTLGNNITIDVQIRNIVDLQGVQLTLLYNSTLLQYQSSTEGNFLTQPVFHEPGVTSGMLSNMLVVKMGPPGISGDGTLFHITFTAIGKGTAIIIPTEALLSDSTGQGILIPLVNGTVTIN